MSSFTEPLQVEYMDNGVSAKILKEFDFHIGSETSPDIIHVPVGFITDFASTPFFSWSLGFAKNGRYTKAAVIHDYLYQTKLRTRLESDAVFYEAMMVLQVSKWKAGLMYWAVRCFGWLGYSKNNLPPSIPLNPILAGGQV